MAMRREWPEVLLIAVLFVVVAAPTFGMGRSTTVMGQGPNLHRVSSAARPTPRSPDLVPALRSKFANHYTAYTLDLCNDSLRAGNWLPKGCHLTPQSLAYDPVKDEIFVANDNSGSVLVLSDSNYLEVANISVGVNPMAVAYDPAKGEIFVANMDSNNVSVISDASNAVVATVPVGASPMSLTYDTGKGEIFVANFGSSTVGNGTVSVISDTTNTVVATILVDNEPDTVVYDSGRGEIFVVNQHAGTVNVISDATNSVVASRLLQEAARGATYDSGQGEVFVGNVASTNLSVISDATNTVKADIPFNTWVLAYDPGTGEVFAANDTGSVGVISDASNAVTSNLPVGLDPEGITYDEANHYVYVCNHGQGTISLLTDGTGGFSNYHITFGETGLPGGTRWSMSMYGATLSATTSSITFQEPNGTYGFATGGVPGYVALPTSGSIVVNGANQTVSITFSSAPPGSYPVTFTESGLPTGTTWSVTLGGTNRTSPGATVVALETNGTYGFSVASVPGYVPSPLSGSVTIKGVGVNQSIVFAPVPPGYAHLTFQESGLSAGTLWSITLASATQSGNGNAFLYVEPAGTYNYTVGSVTGYAANVTSGLVAVNGSARTVYIGFSPIAHGSSYTVTFSESGLPTGTHWSITFNGTRASSSTSTIDFVNLENNTTGYTFAVGLVSGFTSSPSSGSVVVHGANVTLTITFTGLPPGSYPVEFIETGLPSGLSWSVSLSGNFLSSTTTTLSFTEKNGTYSYSVAPPTGYTVGPPSGSLTVSGKAVNQSEVFTKTNTPPGPTLYPVSFTEVGLPQGTNWAVTLNGSTQPSPAPSITYKESNGTYAFAVESISGYADDPASGTTTVRGGPANVSVVFTALSPGYYTVTFGEVGLPTGANWSVSLSGQTRSSNGDVLMFAEANGTYYYTVMGPSGYYSDPASGSLTVHGGDKGTSVTFSTHPASPPPGNSTSPFLGLPGFEGYIVIGVVLAVVAAAVVTLLLRRRKHAHPDPQSAGPST